MDDIRSVRMAGEERAEFLGTGGTGVVSFPTGADDAPYSFPVSYGYDPEDGEFYLRLAFGPDTEKGSVVDDGQHASLVVYDRDDDRWRSVVVTGRLEEVTEAAIDSNVVQAMRRIHIPLVDVFERHPRELTFRFFRLSSAEVTGRKEAQSDD
jgi:nitroimidazol reductase NimA-like FMN-containing flavoprotein (pyridoxamine 5'-phosphate oxidase superfamily)